MSQFSVLKNCKISLVAFKTDGDNESINGTILDMQGYNSVAFIPIGYQGNVGSPTIKVQQDTAVAMGGAADLLGTSTTFTTGSSANGFTCLEVHQPRERYVRAVLTIPNWNAVPVACIALQFNTDLPVSNDGELHISPAEGTA